MAVLAVTARRQQNVDDLAMLVDRLVEMGPLAGDLQVGLVGERPVTRSMPARPRGLDELAGETLHSPVDGHVIHGDAALGQQLPGIAVGQSVPRVPADRDRGHLPREPEASEDRGRARRSHRTSLQPAATGQRNGAPRTAQLDTLQMCVPLLLQRRADGKGDNNSGCACAEQGEDDAAAQEQEQDQSSAQNGVLPGMTERAGKRDGGAEDSADGGGPGSVEEGPRSAVAADQAEPVSAEQDKRE